MKMTKSGTKTKKPPVETGSVSIKDMDSLVQYCKDESQSGFKTSKRIGF